MSYERRRGSTETAAGHAAGRANAPGRRSLTMGLPAPSGEPEVVQRRLSPGEGREAPPPGDDVYMRGLLDAAIRPDLHGMPVQRKAGAHDGGSSERGEDAERGRVHQVAATGISGGATPLPHLDAIQQSFGRHDVTGVKAHVGGAASAAAAAMGAEAYATGQDVAFASAPDLFTAAHEATHVVQQRGGVSLLGGIDGGASDPYERHADEVAGRVVRGESAESLLDSHAGGTPAVPAVQRRRVTLTYLSSSGQIDSGMALETRNLSWQRLEELLEDDSLAPESKKELMRAIDAGEVQDGYPGAYEYATAHLGFLRENLPKFGEVNEFTWLRRITGGGSGTLTGKRDAKGIKTDMSEEEYDATAEISAGFYDTAARLNKAAPREHYLTLYRGFTIPASKDEDAADKLALKIAGFSDVLPSSASWQREESIKMSRPGEGESAVLVYMSIPPDHPIVIMSYPDNEQPTDGRPKALDIGQAEVLVAASTYEDVEVFRVEDLPGGKLRYHVSVRLAPRDPKEVMQGIQTARETAQSSRKPKGKSMDVEPGDLVKTFGDVVAGQIKSATETGGTYVDLMGQSWRLDILADDMFPFTFTSV